MNYVETNELYQFAHSLQQRGHNYDEISVELRQKGAPEILLREIVDKIKTLRLLRKRKTGFVCCTIGVVLLVVGCIITLFLYNSGYDIKLAMYGLTLLGVGFTLKGMVDIMGW